MWDDNPALIQDGGETDPHQLGSGSGRTPVVLIHDGGGTVYSYHLLGPLRRPVYALSNPRFGASTGPGSSRSSSDRIDSGPGTLASTARHYARLVRQAVRSGRVILGGWSLGGLLALETAAALAADFPEIRVLGVVMLDSVCPPLLSGPAGVGGVAATDTEDPERKLERSQPARRVEFVPYKIQWSATTRPATRAAVERCFAEAHGMVAEWVPPPEWAAEGSLAMSVAAAKAAKAKAEEGLEGGDGFSGDGRALGEVVNEAEEDVKDPEGSRSPPGGCGSYPTPGSEYRDDQPNPKPETRTLTPLPPTVLIRARDAVPVPEQPREASSSPSSPKAKEDEEEKPLRIVGVDRDRADPRLGWDRYNPSLFVRLLETPGHHYSVFAEENLDAATRQLRVACDIVEEEGLRRGI